VEMSGQIHYSLLTIHNSLHYLWITLKHTLSYIKLPCNHSSGTDIVYDDELPINGVNTLVKTYNVLVSALSVLNLKN
jgi:hypothetical protein